MSCITGLVDRKNRRIYIGADSAGTNDAGQQTIRADAKVFRLGDFLFGCTTSFRMIQLLRYSFSLPVYTPGEGEEDPIFRYMATDFINAVRGCLKEGGFAKKEEERERGGSFLVAWRGRLFCIGSDYQVGEATNGQDALGSGDDLALGSMYTTVQLDLPPDQCIKFALEAAAYHNANVRAPFLIKSIEYSGINEIVSV